MTPPAGATGGDRAAGGAGRLCACHENRGAHEIYLRRYLFYWTVRDSVRVWVAAGGARRIRGRDEDRGEFQMPGCDLLACFCAQGIMLEGCGRRQQGACATGALGAQQYHKLTPACLLTYTLRHFSLLASASICCTRGCTCQ